MKPNITDIGFFNQAGNKSDRLDSIQYRPLL